MEVVIKAALLAIIVLCEMKQELLAENLHELQISAFRFDNASDALQLSIAWNSSLEDGVLYHVSVHLLPTPSCTIEHTPFVNQQDIRCAPIVSETEETSIVLPSDPRIFRKHECIISALCTYEIKVLPLDYSKAITEVYQVPECVENVCSCYYQKHLPNITANSYFSDNQLVVNWTIGEYATSELPASVTLDRVMITVRRMLSEELVWGGLESSKKSIIVPVTLAGSQTFNVNDFPGNKTIFLVHVRLYDSRQCFSEANPNRVCADISCICQNVTHLSNFSVSTKMEGKAMTVSWDVSQNLDVHGAQLKSVRLVLASAGQVKVLEKLIPWNESHVTLDMEHADTVGVALTLQATIVDANGCEQVASPLSVLVPESKTVQYIILTLIAVCVVGGFAWGAIVLQKKIKTRRVAQNWREVYVTSGVDHHFAPIQMVDNGLYTDMDILEARARGDADQLEVPHSCLRIGREIGKGAFGRVFMASATKLAGCSGPMIVAVKQLKKCPKTDEFDEFLDEIAMLKRVGRHPNIVTLLGCCTIKAPLTMIMEYIGCGDLLEYLRKIRAKHFCRIARLEANNVSHSESTSLQRSISNHSSSTVFGPMVKYMDILHTSSSNSDTSYITQPDTAMRPSLTETMYTTLSIGNGQENTLRKSGSIEYVLDHNELHDFARQIACGMQHLEQIQITHRDLAARNILIDERKTLKISDFGLSRTGIYVNTRNKKVPLRWLSIEAMRDNLYSSKSDVWAFGIVLWEIGTLGGYPYPTVSNHELLTFLNNGNRLERPENCTTELYQLMLNCWKPDPDDRPSFRQISKSLEPHRRIYIDFNQIEPTYVFPPTSEQITQVLANNK